jgi:hypothetical protein
VVGRCVLGSSVLGAGGLGGAVRGSGSALTGEGATVVSEGVLVGCVVSVIVGAFVRDSSALGLSVSSTVGATAGVGTAGVGC